jgi:hypothetical protein
MGVAGRAGRGRAAGLMRGGGGPWRDGVRAWRVWVPAAPCVEKVREDDSDGQGKAQANTGSGRGRKIQSSMARGSTRYGSVLLDRQGVWLKVLEERRGLLFSSGRCNCPSCHFCP